jgi:hypothetical protein
MNQPSKEPELTSPLPPWQAERLERWQAQWELYETLMHEVGAEPQASDVPASAPTPGPGSFMPQDLVAPWDTTIRQGEIRLLPAHLSGFRPHLEVLVLGKWGGENSSEWLVAPYGPLSEPADPSELLTGREEDGLEVLCLWNGRIVPDAILAESWVTDETEPEEVADALAVWTHFMLGDPLPLHLRSVVGPAMSGPEDSRHRYFACERGCIAGLDALITPKADEARAVAVIPTWVRKVFSMVNETAGMAETAVAALMSDWWEERCFAPVMTPRGMDAHNGIGEAAVFQLAVGSNAHVRISEQDDQPGKFRVFVLADPLNELAKAQMVDLEGNVLATFDGKEGDSAFTMVGGIVVRLANGSLARLAEEKS